MRSPPLKEMITLLPFCLNVASFAKESACQVRPFLKSPLKEMRAVWALAKNSVALPCTFSPTDDAVRERYPG